jgi:hypothetical protein
MTATSIGGPDRIGGASRGTASSTSGASGIGPALVRETQAGCGLRGSGGMHVSDAGEFREGVNLRHRVHLLDQRQDAPMFCR